MGNLKPVIALPAYRRAGSLGRLLDSIEAARFPPGVRLVLSLEGRASAEVRRRASEFRSRNLKVDVVQHAVQLGLRNHILACGDIALENGSVIVLEDDLMVDPYFYEYAVAALERYRSDHGIAGIALYSPEYNEYAGVPFRPLRNGYSTYLMRVPCSSGQCWTSEQWRLFRNWMNASGKEFIERRLDLPRQVKLWPESSWKKYFAGYLAAEAKDVVFPYESYTTNCSDAGGTHIPEDSNLHQVELGFRNRLPPSFEFCPTDRPSVAYDPFMEACGTYVHQVLGLSPEQVEVDIAGIKSPELLSTKPFVITSKRVTKPTASFGLRMRPVEVNLEFPLRDSDAGNIRLAKSDAVGEGIRKRRSLAEYDYFAGIAIGSRPVLVAILKQLPRRALRLIHQLLNNG